MLYRILKGSTKYWSSKNRQTVKISKSALSMAKYNDEAKGFVLYDNPKSKSIRVVGAIFGVALLYYAGIIYMFPDPDFRIHQYICGGLSMLGLLAFQLKNRRTLKKMVLDKKGQNVALTFYRLLGFGQTEVQMDVPCLKGIRPLNKLLKVPVFKYDNGRSSYLNLFNSQGIMELEAFHSVMNGNYIIVHDPPK